VKQSGKTKPKGKKGDISSYTFSKKQINEDEKSNNDDFDSSEMKVWVEIYDEVYDQWCYIDPLKKIFTEDQVEIDKKLNGVPGLYAIAFQRYEISEDAPKTETSKSKYYMKDLTSRYVGKWHKVLVSRRQLGLEAWWNQISKYFMFDPFISTEKWRKIHKIENELLITLQKKDVPQNFREFCVSKHYMLSSQLRKYEGFIPEAVPIDIKCKDEFIYEKSAVQALHTKSRWVREMRKVKKGEVAYKKVLSLIGNNDAFVDLYGFWQTEPHENIIQQDGTLPKNDYGNFEIVNGAVPPGTVHIDRPGLPRLLKKLEIEYVEVVVGFERGSGGRTHVVKSGVLVHKKDEELILDAFEKYKEEIMKKEAEKNKKEVLKLWKWVFRKLMVKKYVSETYQSNNVQ